MASRINVADVCSSWTGTLGIACSEFLRRNWAVQLLRHKRYEDCLNLSTNIYLIHVYAILLRKLYKIHILELLTID